VSKSFERVDLFGRVWVEGRLLVPDGSVQDVPTVDCEGREVVEATSSESSDTLTTTTLGATSTSTPPSISTSAATISTVPAPQPITDDGAVLQVGDVQFVRQPGVVAFSPRVRPTEMLDKCLGTGDRSDVHSTFASFGEVAEIRVRLEGTTGCDGGSPIRLDSALQVTDEELSTGPTVLDVAHPSGLKLRVTLTPREP